MPHICSPYVPDLGRNRVSSDVSADEAATNERVDNVRVLPLTRKVALRYPVRAEAGCSALVPQWRS